MFHTYTYQSAGFQDWLKASDQLYLTKYLELGGKKKDYLSLQIDAQSSDQYLLYIDDEAGVCGSAVLTSLPYAFEMDGQNIPEGTWALRNVLFHIRAGHHIQEQPENFSRIVKQFHFGLFEHLWQATQTSSHQLALSFQSDLEAHEDLQFFGGFTFKRETLLEDEDRSLSIGIMPLTAKTYKTYEQKKKKSFKDINLYTSFLSPKLRSNASKVVL